VNANQAGSDLAAAVAHTRERTELASRMYEAMVKDRKMLRGHLLLTYRCPKRCAVLHVLSTPQGVIFGWPRYKTAPQTTEGQSSPSGRTANTEDGHRRWKRRASFSDSVANAPVRCDHLMHVLELAEIQSDLDDEHYPRDVVVSR